jgi:hypothetical protein
MTCIHVSLLYIGSDECYYCEQDQFMLGYYTTSQAIVLNMTTRILNCMAAKLAPRDWFLGNPNLWSTTKGSCNSLSRMHHKLEE